MDNYLEMSRGHRTLTFSHFGELGSFNRELSEKFGTCGVGVRLLLAHSGRWGEDYILEMEYEVFDEDQGEDSSEHVTRYYRIDPKTGKLIEIDLWERP